jgi:hypothetical protein
VVAGGMVSGLGQGLSFRAGLAAVTTAAPPAQRGAVASTFFVVAYVAISLPVVGVGVLAAQTDLKTAGEIVSLVVAVLSVLTFRLLQRGAGGAGPAGAAPAAS